MFELTDWLFDSSQRDKNKELEAKNKELDRKLKEEVALREKAEARCVEFRKRLRAASGDANLSNLPEQTGEDPAPKTNSLGANGQKDATQIGPTNNGNATITASKALPASKEVKSTPAKSAASSAGATVDEQEPSSRTPPKQPNGQGAVGAAKVQVGNNAAKTQTPTTATKAQPAAATMVKGGEQSSVTKPLTQGKNVSVAVPAVVPGNKTPATSPTKSQQHSTLGEGPSSTVTEPQALHGRSNSHESASKVFDSAPKGKVDTPAKMEIPRPSTVTASKSAPAQRAPMPSSAPQTPQQSRPPVSRPVVSAQNTPIPASRGTSLNDFDPLGPNASSSNLENGVWPVISFPTNVSLGAVPLGSAASFFQNHGGQAYQATAPAPEQYNQAAFMNENHYVVPIAFGMTSSDMGGGQQHLANGFQMHQPLTLQQPIMLQQVQGGVQQWSAHMQQHQIPTNTQPYYPQQGIPQQQQHVQQPPLQPQPVPSNPFDPFSN